MSEGVELLFRRAPEGTTGGEALRRPDWGAAAEAARPLFAPADSPSGIAKRKAEEARERERQAQEQIRREREREEARAQEGFRAGYESGQRAAAAEAQTRLEALGGALGDLARLRGEVLAASEAEVVKLALAIAQEVVARDVEAQKAFVVEATAEALRLLKDADQVTLRLTPKDARALAPSHPELFANPRVSVVEDPAMGLGGVVADCALGRVDAALTSRLAAIAARLDGAGGP